MGASQAPPETSYHSVPCSFCSWLLVLAIGRPAAMYLGGVYSRGTCPITKPIPILVHVLHRQQNIDGKCLIEAK